MPNSPKTPTRTIRVSNELWNAVKEKAAADKRTVTDVIIQALKQYLEQQTSPKSHLPASPPDLTPGGFLLVYGIPIGTRTKGALNAKY